MPWCRPTNRPTTVFTGPEPAVQPSLYSLASAGWLGPPILTVTRQQTYVEFMKTSLLQKWVAFVYRHSQGRVWPCFYLSITIVLCILEILHHFHFTEHSHIHFLLIMLVITLLGFERFGFSQLLLARDREIERLRHENKPSA